MGSPAHRANLLRERFREIGVAAARGTPFDASEANGVTISSEYGFRPGKRVRPLRRSRSSGHLAARFMSVGRRP